MEDKSFEFLEKMYADIKGELTNIKTIINKKADKTDIVRIENEHGKKLDALFDGYKHTYSSMNKTGGLMILKLKWTTCPSE